MDGVAKQKNMACAHSAECPDHEEAPHPRQRSKNQRGTESKTEGSAESTSEVPAGHGISWHCKEGIWSQVTRHLRKRRPNERPGADLGAKYVIEGERLAGEGWNFVPDEMKRVANPVRQTVAHFSLCLSSFGRMSANVKKESGSTVNDIAEELTEQTIACVKSPTVFAFRETTTWKISELNVSGYVFLALMPA